MDIKQIRSRCSKAHIGLVVAAPLVLMSGCAHLGVGSGGLGGMGSSRGDLTTTLEQANREYEQGRLDLARRDYEALRNKVPDNALVLLQLGNIDYRVGNMDGAREMYEKSLQAEPKQPEVQFNLAMVELGLAQKHLRTYNSMSDQTNPEITKLMSAIDDFAHASATLTKQQKAGSKTRLEPSSD